MMPEMPFESVNCQPLSTVAVVWAASFTVIPEFLLSLSCHVVLI